MLPATVYPARGSWFILLWAIRAGGARIPQTFRARRKDCVERVSLTAINGEAIDPPNVDNPPREPAPVTGLEKPDLSILSDKFLAELRDANTRAPCFSRANLDASVLLTTFSDTLADALRTKLRRLAKMNFAIRGTDNSQIKWNNEDSFLNDSHKDLKADYVIANHPFNFSDWSGDVLRTDGRWKYGIPLTGNANYAWIQHLLYHLSPSGQTGFVAAKGSLKQVSIQYSIQVLLSVSVRIFSVADFSQNIYPHFPRVYGTVLQNTG